jgi:hypothetical protein
MDWVKDLKISLPGYLSSLQVDDQDGRYRPCASGATRLGKQISLGYSCFAAKLARILGLWQAYPAQTQKSWIHFIQSFQVSGSAFRIQFSDHAFIDRALIFSSQHYWAYPEQLLYQLYANLLNPSLFLRQVLKARGLSSQERSLIAETKQAIATLVEMGAQSLYVYTGFPSTPEAIYAHLRRLDWRQPWGAGGQAAAIPVFITTQAPRFLAPSAVDKLSQSCTHFFESIVDQETGAFYQGPLPKYGNLVNGAMKVLTALDWLNSPIPHPKQLIDTVLTQLPPPDGCHLVDSIYVLYRCLNQIDHRRQDIQTYCRQVLEMIRRHYNKDGGFSYSLNRSQTGYYGVRISRGLPESDLHGTILLTWAVAMILEILDANEIGLQVIKP